MNEESNVVESQIEIQAPLSKVWDALTDAKLFGQWFGTVFESAFVPGKTTKGKNTGKSCESNTAFHIKEIKPKSYFSYAWTPYPMDPTFDYSVEEPTLVEFFLTEIPSGTLLQVKESGFTKVTASRRAEAYKMHTHGWQEQLRNIEEFVGQNK